MPIGYWRLITQSGWRGVGIGRGVAVFEIAEVGVPGGVHALGILFPLAKHLLHVHDGAAINHAGGEEVRPSHLSGLLKS